VSSKRIRKKRAKEWNNCPLCGRKLPPDPSRYVVGSSGRAICDHCLQAANRVKGIAKDPASRPERALPFLYYPTEILRQLNERIIGQEAAKKAVVMSLWKQALRARGEDIPNAPLLLYGPTGCGKTALVREAAQLMDLPFLSFDTTSISETGYRGKDAVEIVHDLVKSCKSLSKATYGVIFLDEFDKIAVDKHNSYRGSYCRGTQVSLLKLIEGLEVETDKGKIDTKNILFIFGGAFSALTDKQRQKPVFRRTVGFLREDAPLEEPASRPLMPEDFVAFGMEPELMGRVGRCIGLEALTEEYLRKILLESQLSVYRKYQAYFRKKGKTLTMSEAEMDDMIQKALQRGMGARGLYTLVEEWIEPQMAALAEELYGQVG